MTRASEKKPSSPPPSGAARTQHPKAGRGQANSETFGRFVRNLARLEGGGGRMGKAGAGKGGEGGR